MRKVCYFRGENAGFLEEIPFFFLVAAFLNMFVQTRFFCACSYYYLSHCVECGSFLEPAPGCCRPGEAAPWVTLLPASSSPSCINIHGASEVWRAGVYQANLEMQSERGGGVEDRGPPPPHLPPLKGLRGRGGCSGEGCLVWERGKASRLTFGHTSQLLLWVNDCYRDDGSGSLEEWTGPG